MTISPPAGPASSTSAAEPESRPTLPGRTCGSCTLCCKTVAVTELAKPAGAWCTHCRRSKGCTIYDSRPAGCRDFHCEWMRSEKLGREWKPDRAKFALMVTATGHLAACIDPGFPSAWRRAPYYQALRHWARERADSPSSSWPAVDVWIGKRCILILPDGETDLGIVATDEEVRIDCSMTLAGPVYAASKFRVADTGTAWSG
ncbi:MAG TPA: hypothetical protein VF605_09845 [Allosphingosinicella sp.]|jgi:hypothetical protein